MKRNEEILRNRAFRDLKKKGIYSIEGKSIHEIPLNKLKSFYFKETGKILTPRSRKFTKNHIKGYIYLLESNCKSFYKIGFSNNPKRRLKSIQSSCPLNLTLLNYFEGNIPLEKSLHSNLKSYNIRGEWYKHSSFVLESFINFSKEI